MKPQTFAPIIAVTVVAALSAPIRLAAQEQGDDLEARWNLHLKPFFDVLRAVEVTSQLVARCIDVRQREGASNASINRELAALKRMFNLARQSTAQSQHGSLYFNAP